MINAVTPKEAVEIIATCKPIGKFLLIENGRFIGIDNSTEEAWTEEFLDVQDCIEWLNGKERNEMLEDKKNYIINHGMAFKALFEILNEMVAILMKQGILVHDTDNPQFYLSTIRYNEEDGLVYFDVDKENRDD